MLKPPSGGSRTKTRDATRGPSRPRLAAFKLALGITLLACNFAAVEAEGEFGRPIALVSVDASPLPRLAFLREPSPGTPGGCSEVCLGPPDQCDPGACMPILIDSATAITMLADDTDVAVPERTCFELRSADLLLDPQAEVTVLGEALSRFRFSNTPVVRLPRDPSQLAQPFGWRTGRWVVNLLLLIATIISTLLVGMEPQWDGASVPTLSQLLTGWPFSLSLLLILGAHELGHYFAARYHNVPVTLP